MRSYLPEVKFKVRVRDESIGGDNPYKWEEKTTSSFFASKRVVLFSLPGALHQLAQLSNYQVLKKNMMR